VDDRGAFDSVSSGTRSRPWPDLRAVMVAPPEHRATTGERAWTPIARVSWATTDCLRGTTSPRSTIGAGRVTVRKASSDLLGLVVGGIDGGDGPQQLDGAAYALDPADVDVLVLDGQPAVVAPEAQAVAELAPPGLGVAVAEGDVPPRAVGEDVERSVFQACGGRDLGGVDVGVLAWMW
jgi:hypothetical protein